jgi:benzoyl-CoA reductase/2-hydroxyglutaryl-CoA dehydratase subunit BcrC/BadD/HgdB
MKAIAYSSPFVPAEWIAAHGFRPHRLRLRATEGLARGICPYAGALIDAAQTRIDASALVMTTVCDQMRYAAALLESRGTCPVFLLNVPSTWQTAAARQLYFDEIRRLGRFMVELGGKPPTNCDLAQTMRVYEQDRDETSRELTVPGTIVETTAGVPLAILGGPLMDGDNGLFEIVKRAGGRLVLDATEGGSRTMPRRFDPARMASDPLQELADAYFDGIPDVFRRPNSGLYEWLDRELTARGVRGIIFWRYVWCDLWHAELHRLRQWSPMPVLEIDVGPDGITTPNRVQGRIEAFLEMLQ